MSTEGHTLLVRADGGATIGAGHIMRSLALAMEWCSHGGNALFLANCPDDKLARRITAAGMSFRTIERSHPDPSDLQFTLSTANELGRLRSVDDETWLVLDGYHFGSTYQEAINAAGIKLLVMDDSADLAKYWADVVVNQNLHAKQMAYHCTPNTKLLQGPKYALLRPEFQPWRDWKREIPEVARRILVTMGGADPQNVTVAVIRAIGQLNYLGIEARVVVGPSNAHFHKVLKAAQDVPWVSILTDVADMAEQMAWADVAVSAAGSTCWELLFMGLPFVAVSVADNQEPISAVLADRGLASVLDPLDTLETAAMASALRSLMISPMERARMSALGRQLVDGEGASRVLAHMRPCRLTLRRFCREDAEKLWLWANDPEVRAVSFEEHLITWDEHTKWLERKLPEPGFHQYIALDFKQCPIGQIRFETTAREATVSLALEKRCRGLGYGPLLLELGIRELLRHRPVERVHAYVKPENKQSMRCFTRAGFSCCGSCLIKGQEAMHFTFVTFESSLD